MRSLGSEKGHRMPLGKPTPSKWDDAQKWLVNLSGVGDKNKAKASPRNSNADDRRLITAVPKDYWISEEEEGEMKNVDWAESTWRSNKPVNSPDNESVSRSIDLRDMGTEMTPIASQEPSRSATPVRTGNTESRSQKPPSRSSTSVKCLNEQMGSNVATPSNEESNQAGKSDSDYRQLKEVEVNSAEDKSNDECKKMKNPLEARAAAWDEAERAKYMARYKREEVKIQAWENEEKRKAEMECSKAEAEAERLKSGAQEEYKRKMETTQRIAEEKRAAAESKLKEKLATTGERADYIRTRGHLPSSCLNFFPFNLKKTWFPSWSWCRCC